MFEILKCTSKKLYEIKRRYETIFGQLYLEKLQPYFNLQKVNL